MYNFQEVNLELLRKMATQKWGQAQDDIISLSNADIDFPPAVEIKEGIKKALEEGRTFYGELQGDRDVLEVICAKLKNKNNLNVTIDDIYLIPGAMFGVFLACWYSLRPGDEAIITPSPVHGPFYANVINVGGKVIYNNIRESDYSLDLEDLKKRITKRTKLLLVCNPHNPTGRVFTKEELEGVADLAKKYNLNVLSDELYEDLIFAGEHISLASLDNEIAKRTITVFGFSKAYNIAGLRVAYIVNQGRIIQELKRKLPAIIVHTDRLAQAAAKAALSEAGAWLESLKQHLIEMKNYCLERVKSLPDVKCFPPQAGYFLFLNLKAYKRKSEDIADYLQKKAKVLVIPGIHFGPAGEGYLRINFATSKSILKEAFDRIETALRDF